MKTILVSLMIAALSTQALIAQTTFSSMSSDSQLLFKQWVQEVGRRKAAFEKAEIDFGEARGSKDEDAKRLALQDKENLIRQEFINHSEILVLFLYQPASQSVTLLKSGILSQTEQKQLTKQAGAAAATPGSTSLTSKGPAASLISMGVENGALQQTVSGTVVTIRGNPAGVLTALAKKNLVSAADAFHDDSNLRFLKRFNISATFDVSRGPQPNVFDPSNNQLTGYSGRVDLYNHRDPRHPAWDKDWALLIPARQTLANRAGEFAAAIADALDPRKTPAPTVVAWLNTALGVVERSAAGDLEAALLGIMDSAKSAFSSVGAATSTVGDALLEYATARNAIIDKASSSPVTTFEYNNTRQFGQATTAAPAPPDLSNLRLVHTRQFVAGATFTFNASTTLFNSRPQFANGTRLGRVRDVQGSAEFDIPLPAIANLGKGTVGFSGLWLRLMEEPLGQKVQINGKDISSKGTVGVAQLNVSFPVTNGIQIPLALSYATRTELLPNKSEVRGNIGLLLDLDKLFSKASQ